jgi:hypothetical protein
MIANLPMEVLDDHAKRIEKLERRMDELEEKKDKQPRIEKSLVLKYPILELEEYPEGQVGDWLIAVLNVFGKVGVEEQGVSARIERKRLLALICMEMDITEKVAKARLRTLINGHWLKEEFGCVKFPVERLRTKPRGS